MDKLRRWLIDIENGKITRKESGVLHYDDVKGFEGMFILEECEVAAEPETPRYGKERLSIEEYIKVLRRKHFDSIKDVPVKVCMDYYNRCRDEFIDGNLDVMPECLQQYVEDKRTAVCGFSMEYLRIQQRRAVMRLLECCCINESHLKIKDRETTLEGYRMELGMNEGAVDEEMLKKYAFFRRFFSYNNWRYQLTDMENVARHFYLNTFDGDKDKIMQWFANYTLLMCIQMDMDELSMKDGYKLRQIKNFDPFAVLEMVDMIGDYAVDKEMVRGMWVEMMLRSEEIVRKYEGKLRECFEGTKKNEQFGRWFVLATIGKMKKYNKYKSTYRELAEVIECGGISVDTTEKYIKGEYDNLHVIPKSLKLILSLIGVVKEN